MPYNLPGSNIQDLNKNGCFIWERVRFTIIYSKTTFYMSKYKIPFNTSCVLTIQLISKKCQNRPILWTLPLNNESRYIKNDLGYMFLEDYQLSNFNIMKIKSSDLHGLFAIRPYLLKSLLKTI
jgi:hypothetical protein